MTDRGCDPGDCRSAATVAASDSTGAGGGWLGSRWGRAALLAALALVLLTRIATVYRENVNWDEFGLLHHVSWSAESGVLHSAGRPGLAVVALLPLLGDCPDEMSVIHRARLLWLGITVLLLGGLAALVAEMRRDSATRWREAGLAVALLAMVPAFLQWSIEVRTDQIALAGGLWGGAVLLASRRRPVLAVLAGLLFAIGYLATQKVVYTCLLAGVLTLADLWLWRRLEIRREALRVGLALAAAAATIALFYAAVGFFENPNAVPAAANEALTPAYGMRVFDFYRKTIGYSQYAALLPGLLPHAALLLLLIAASCSPRCRQGEDRRLLVLAWVVLVLGVAVGLFHAAAFGYFWMTLGLFPAVGLALAWHPTQPLLDRLSVGRRRLVVLGFWCVLTLPALQQAADLLRDTQSVQRSSLAFVERNFGAGEEGFQPEGAIFCRAGERPLPVFYSQLLFNLFGSGEQRAEDSTGWLLAHFNQRQVRFLVQSWRFEQFPAAVREFWSEHYLPYRDAVWVAGRSFDGSQRAPVFDLIVDGEYRWVPLAGPLSIRIDGQVLEPGQRTRLAAGRHRANLGDRPGPGVLVLAIADPPGDEGRRFYALR